MYIIILGKSHIFVLDTGHRLNTAHNFDIIIWKAVTLQVGYDAMFVDVIRTEIDLMFVTFSVNKIEYEMAIKDIIKTTLDTFNGISEHTGILHLT